MSDEIQKMIDSLMDMDLSNYSQSTECKHDRVLQSLFKLKVSMVKEEKKEVSDRGRNKVSNL